jgi:hypothetical protein
MIAPPLLNEVSGATRQHVRTACRAASGQGQPVSKEIALTITVRKPGEMTADDLKENHNLTWAKAPEFGHDSRN